jgi:hypothetical protein
MHITKHKGFYIINGVPHIVTKGVVSFDSSRTCEEFESLEALKQECEARGIDYEFDAREELLDKAHRERYPQLYKQEGLE